MTSIEIPVEAELVENENLGLSSEEIPICMATIFIEHIVMITEQPDKTALITLAGALEVVSTLSYLEVKELLK